MTHVSDETGKDTLVRRRRLSRSGGDRPVCCVDTSAEAIIGRGITNSSLHSVVSVLRTRADKCADADEGRAAGRTIVTRSRFGSQAEWTDGDTEEILADTSYLNGLLCPNRGCSSACA